MPQLLNCTFYDECYFLTGVSFYSAVTIKYPVNAVITLKQLALEICSVSPSVLAQWRNSCFIFGHFLFQFNSLTFTDNDLKETECKSVRGAVSILDGVRNSNWVSFHCCKTLHLEVLAVLKQSLVFLLLARRQAIW